MRIGMRTVKTVISVFFSMVTAGSLSLLYWPAAGIIALLSVGNTKRSTLRTGMNRIAAFILATATALFSFFAVGYTILASVFFIPVHPACLSLQINRRDSSKFGFGHSLFSGGKHVLAADRQ